MTSTDVNDLLMSGGVPSAKFPDLGTVVRGTIVRSEAAQQTDFQSNTPKFYDDGKPMMQIIITLQTDERDTQIDGDDGLRKVYVRGQMLAALRQAVRAASEKSLLEGGQLAIKYDHDKPADKPGRNPAKQYVVQYKPPAASQPAVDDLLAGSSSVSTDDI